jgi:hypothetical protein
MLLAMRPTWRAVTLPILASTLALACGGSSDDGLVDVVEERPDAPPIAPATECVVTTAREPATSAAHEDVCSVIDYPRFPPAGGPHFQVWADFGTYDEPVEPGYLVHSLEHGAVALLHNCPDGCPEVLDAFAAIATAHADDVLCRDHPAGSRIIIAPDPTLDVAIAAVAWEHLYLATCLDEPSLTAFVDAHYAQAPEDLCAPGTATPVCP